MELMPLNSHKCERFSEYCYNLMNEPVYILGGGRTDFKRNLKKEGKTIRDLITKSGREAIQDAETDPRTQTGV
jgi:hypothetical protein